MLCTLSFRKAVGQGNEVAIGGPGSIELVSSLFEFLEQIEHLLFQLADVGPECPEFVGAARAKRWVLAGRGGLDPWSGPGAVSGRGWW